MMKPCLFCPLIVFFGISPAFKAAGLRAQVIDASDRGHIAFNRRFVDPEDAKVTGKAMVFPKSLLRKNDTK